jgi:phosphate transport system protein
MASELRGEYHRDIDRLDISLGALLSVVPEAVGNATGALMSCDTGLRVEIDRWRGMVSEISSDVDHTAELLIARQAPVAGDLRFLMACVRLVLNLSDTIDLVGDIGGSVAGALGGPLPDRVCQLLVATGEAAADTWRSVADLWHERVTADLAVLRVREDRLAETRASLAAELVSGTLDPATVVDLAGAARCYERIGRHATTAGHLIDPLLHPATWRAAGGTPPDDAAFGGAPGGAGDDPGGAGAADGDL